jgi:hypothetical protein
MRNADFGLRIEEALKIDDGSALINRHPASLVVASRIRSPKSAFRIRRLCRLTHRHIPRRHPNCLTVK